MPLYKCTLHLTFSVIIFTCITFLIDLFNITSRKDPLSERFKGTLITCCWASLKCLHFLSVIEYICMLKQSLTIVYNSSLAYLHYLAYPNTITSSDCIAYLQQLLILPAFCALPIFKSFYLHSCQASLYRVPIYNLLGVTQCHIHYSILLQSLTAWSSMAVAPLILSLRLLSKPKGKPLYFGRQFNL